MIRALPLLICLALPAILGAAEFRHFGNFILKSHFKITGDRVTSVPMKPIVFHVSTDGVQVRISAEGDDESHTSFEIYRADGIGRQRSGESALDIIPGIQAMSKSSGVLRHLRLTRESLTITTFPGVSDQTIVSHAVATDRATAIEPPAPPTAGNRVAKPAPSDPVNP